MWSKEATYRPYVFKCYFFLQTSMSAILTIYLLDTLATIPTTVTPMPTVQTPKDRSTAHVTRDTLEMELLA